MFNLFVKKNILEQGYHSSNTSMLCSAKEFTDPYLEHLRCVGVRIRFPV